MAPNMNKSKGKLLQATHISSKREFLRLSALGIGALTVGLPLVGCGDGSSNTTTTAPKTGNFVEVPVQGLGYSSKSYSGITGPSGSFNYSPDEPITFTVGNVIIGTISRVPSDGLVTTYDLVGQSRKSWWNIKSIVIAQFLQSIHSDLGVQTFIKPKYVKDAQGNTTVEFEGVMISIPQSVHDNLKKVPLTYLNDPSGVHITQTDLAALVKIATDGKKPLVSCVAAETHQIFYPV